MRILTRLFQLLLFVLLALSPLAALQVSAGPGDQAEGPATYQGNSGKNDDDGDGDANRGHGNDPDGVDEDNPGRGNDKDKEDQGEAVAPVVVTVQYRVELECKVKDDDDRDLTECEFRGVAPDDAEKLQRVIVPESTVCADVIGGDFERVEVHTGEGLSGYASEEDKDKLKLELTGAVTLGGTETYWIVTESGLFPAEGPALDCGDAGAAALELSETSTPAPTSTPVPDTGELAVVMSTCTDVPADTTGFDWFGSCQPGGETAEYRVSPASGDGMEAWTITTDAEGEAVLEGLEPGNYRLEATGEPWCHAKSDNVTPESEVVIEAGERTTVYLFQCEGDKSGG